MRTGPPGRRPPTRSVATSIRSSLLRGPFLHSVRVTAWKARSVNRVDLLEVASPDPGDEVTRARSAGLALADRLPRQRGPVALENGPRLVALIRAGATFRAGAVVESHRETPGVAAGPVGRADPRLLGVHPVYEGRIPVHDRPVPGRPRHRSKARHRRAGGSNRVSHGAIRVRRDTRRTARSASRSPGLTARGAPRRNRTSRTK